MPDGAPARVSHRGCQGLTQVMTGEGSRAHRPREQMSPEVLSEGILPVPGPSYTGRYAPHWLSSWFFRMAMAFPAQSHQKGVSKTGGVTLGFHIHGSVCLQSYLLKCPWGCTG